MRDGSETRERIRETALRLFVTKGIAETSVRDIARGAGVAQGSLYNHFASKDDLAWELFSENFSAIGDELRRRHRRHDAIEDKLRAMIQYLYEMFDEDWVLGSFVFFSRHEQVKRVTSEQANPYLVFHNVIAGAIGRDEIPRQDSDIATSMVCGAIMQVVDNRILGRVKRGLVEATDAVTAGCLAMLKG